MRERDEREGGGHVEGSFCIRKERPCFITYFGVFYWSAIEVEELPVSCTATTTMNTLGYKAPQSGGDN